MVRSPALKQRRPRLALYILAAIVTGGMLWSRTGSLGRWAAAPGSSLAAAWAEAANVTLAAQLPGWALCPQPPCQYGHLEDGDVDPASVSFSIAVTCSVRPCRHTALNGRLPLLEQPLQEPWHSVFGEDEWLFNNIFYMKRNGFILEFGKYTHAHATSVRLRAPRQHLGTLRCIHPYCRRRHGWRCSQQQPLLGQGCRLEVDAYRGLPQ